MEANRDLTIVAPGEGRRVILGAGFGVDFKFWGDDTGGAISVVEHPFAPGVLVPPHIHTREDEYSIVIEGEIGSALATRRSLWGRADISPNPATSSTPCGTPGPPLPE